jgi:hypothetical protein
MSALLSGIGRTRGDIGGAILIVGIGVDDDIRPPFYARVQPARKPGQPLIFAERYDMIDTVAYHLYFVRAAVIDNEPFKS